MNIIITYGLTAMQDAAPDKGSSAPLPGKKDITHGKETSANMVQIRDKNQNKVEKKTISCHYI